MTKSIADQRKNKKPGYLYILSNKAIPGYVKVGFSTRSGEARAKDISIGSPLPYVVEYQVRIEGHSLGGMEQRIHNALSEYQTEAREWFCCSPDYAKTILKHVTKNYCIS